MVPLIDPLRTWERGPASASTSASAAFMSSGGLLWYAASTVAFCRSVAVTARSNA